MALIYLYEGYYHHDMDKLFVLAWVKAHTVGYPGHDAFGVGDMSGDKKDTNNYEGNTYKLIVDPWLLLPSQNHESLITDHRSPFLAIIW